MPGSKFNANGGEQAEEQPLFQSMAPASMGKMCFVTVIGALVCAWCLLDSWNRQVSSDLFAASEVKSERVYNLFTGETEQFNTKTDSTLTMTAPKDEVDMQTMTMTHADVSHPFNFPLTLAFIQFAFMGLLFLGFWWMLARHPAADVAGVRENLFGAQWAGLVTSHVFSTFWLQALMMPTQLMTPAVFAASRALELPAAAAFRSKVMGAKFGGHPVSTTSLMFGAAMLMIYTQTQIAGCLCMWSGHGVQLAGVALVLVYILVLIVPAANAVCLESVMVDLDTNHFLMLAVMNIIACLCFVPILGFAHAAGFEDVRLAFVVTTGSQQLSMLVLWLCAQIALFSVVNLALIGMMDSFWAVALRSFRAVFWWCSQLMYMWTIAPMQPLCPYASYWGFIMLGACLLAGVSAVIDANTAREPVTEAKPTGINKV